MFLEKREKEDNYYKNLQDVSLERLEQLCWKLWTDYNVHDPGITIADYFNYALLELDYRLKFPFESYLLDSSRRVVPFDQKGLLSKEELFTHSIVKEYDYEKLFVREFRSLKRCVVRLNKKTRLYDVFIELKENSETIGFDKTSIIDDMKRTYHKNRNLCENLGEVLMGFEKLEDPLYYQKERRFIYSSYEAPAFDKREKTEEQNIKPFSSEYHSLQFDFPECYGIGEMGLPAKTNISNEAKILQLKAYLLIYDLILADTLEQACSVKDFLDFSGMIPESSMPDVFIPEGERIIDRDKKNNCKLHSDAYYDEQKAIYLDLLDVLYGEDTRAYFNYEDSKAHYRELNEKRSKLISSLPQLNTNRFLSFDIYDPYSVPNIQVMMESLTDNKYQTSETESFSKYGLRIISDEAFFEKYKFLQGYAFSIENNKDIPLLEIAKIDVVYDNQTFYKLRKNINLLWYNVLFKSFLKYGDVSSYYKILPLPENEYLLVFKHPERNEWINLGLFFNSIERLTVIANLFWLFMRRIKDKKVRNSFYFIEHLLLESENTDDKNNISIITSKDQKSQKDKEYINELLVERLPIHLRVSIYYVSSEKMNHFETLYFNWRKALADQNNRDIKGASFFIRAFLNRNQNTDQT
jgi:hypothetical protein